MEARAAGAPRQAVAVTQCSWMDGVVPAEQEWLVLWQLEVCRGPEELPQRPLRRGGSPALSRGSVDQQLQQAPLWELPGCAGTSSECSYPEFSRSPLFVAVKTQTNQSSKKSPASINRCSGLLHRAPSGVPPASQPQMFRAPNSASPGSKAITGTSCPSPAELLSAQSCPVHPRSAPSMTIPEKLLPEAVEGI